MQAKFGCQTHFSGDFQLFLTFSHILKKAKIILKKTQWQYQIDQERENGKIPQNTRSEPLRPCFPEWRCPI